MTYSVFEEVLCVMTKKSFFKLGISQHYKVITFSFRLDVCFFPSLKTERK